jgi:hypothetical protein
MCHFEPLEKLFKLKEPRKTLSKNVAQALKTIAVVKVTTYCPVLGHASPGRDVFSLKKRQTTKQLLTSSLLWVHTQACLLSSI